MQNMNLKDVFARINTKWITTPMLMTLLSVITIGIWAVVLIEPSELNQGPSGLSQLPLWLIMSISAYFGIKRVGGKISTTIWVTCSTVFLFFLAITRHAKLLGDSGFYSRQVSSMITTGFTESGVEPKVFLSGPLSSLLMWLSIDKVPQLANWLSPLLLLVVITVLIFTVNKFITSGGGGGYILLFIASSPFLNMFAFGYVDQYALSATIGACAIASYFCLREGDFAGYKFRMLLTGYLIGSLAISHLSLIPIAVALGILTLIKIKNLKSRITLFIGGILAPISLALIAKYLHFGLIVANANAGFASLSKFEIDWGRFIFVASILISSLATTFVISLTSRNKRQKPDAVNVLVFSGLLFIYFVWLSVFKFDLGYKEDADLALLPIFIVSLFGFMAYTKEHYEIQNNKNSTISLFSISIDIRLLLLALAIANGFVFLSVTNPVT